MLVSQLHRISIPSITNTRMRNKDVKPVRQWVYHNAPSAGVPQMDKAPAATHSLSLGASHTPVIPTSAWMAREELSRQGQGINLSYKSCWAESSLIQLLPTPPDSATLLPPAAAPFLPVCACPPQALHPLPLWQLPHKTAGTKLCCLQQCLSLHWHTGRCFPQVSVVSEGKCNLSREDPLKSDNHFGGTAFTKRG